ncbi:MAG: tetratricopeptide repeat protein [Candidatus Krumholzibacteriota bacterium]|nr:tetratricopeptide repeat protein [Candidatus Krumholzibacteriota bacterium]
MKILAEMRARRVPQYLSAYILGGWGVVQFIAFLEDRLLLSPHLVNLVLLALVLLLPSVVALAWGHGRPGANRWSRTEKTLIPANLAVTAFLAVLLFGGKELGAVTRTVAVRDENGAVSRRAVPKASFRRRVMVHYLANGGDPAADWARRGLALLLVDDLGQDPFLDVAAPFQFADALREAGHADGLDLPPALERKLARDGHFTHFVTGEVGREGGVWRVSLQLHDSDSGRAPTTRVHTGRDLLALVDEASRQVREDLELPDGHLAAQEDRPVAEILSADLGAVRDMTAGVVAMLHDNDWQGAVDSLKRAVAADPGFASAQYLLSAALTVTGDPEGAGAAMSAAMANLYRLSEREQLQIKSFYYYNEKEDPEKAMAVADMWIQLYPDDTNAYAQKAFLSNLRGDTEAAIAAHERILEIDPLRHGSLLEIAEYRQRRGEFEEAERRLRRYAEHYPQEVRSHTKLAMLYEEWGRLDEAREALETAQLLEPDNRQTLLELAEVDIRQGRFDAARAACDDILAAAETPKARQETLELMMSLLRARGRFREARDSLEIWRDIASMANPLEVNIRYGWHLSMLAEAGQAAAVLADLRALRGELPPSVQPILGMYEARALLELGRLDDAAAATEETEAWTEKMQAELLRPQLLSLRGRLAEARGELDEALAAYRTAMELQPNSESFRTQAGRALRRLGRREDSRETLESALRSNPAQPEANLEMALLLHDLHRDQEARGHLARTLAAWDAADDGYRPAAEARDLAAALGMTPSGKG